MGITQGCNLCKNQQEIGEIDTDNFDEVIILYETYLIFGFFALGVNSFPFSRKDKKQILWFFELFYKII